MLTKDQWNAMNAQQQWDLVQLLDNAVDGLEGGDKVLVSQRWVDHVKTHLPFVLEGDEFDRAMRTVDFMHNLVAGITDDEDTHELEAVVLDWSLSSDVDFIEPPVELG